MLEGFTVSSAGKASLLWSAAFPPENEAVQGAAAPAFNSPIYSYAKARQRLLESSMPLQAPASALAILEGCHIIMLSLLCKHSSGSEETLWDELTGRLGAAVWHVLCACGHYRFRCCNLKQVMAWHRWACLRRCWEIGA